jgi:hypothetical protein
LQITSEVTLLFSNQQTKVEICGIILNRKETL